MKSRKLTIEDINSVRDIEGFPKGTDENIIDLSNAPWYTACPNPFIEEFIEKYGTPYDERTDDYNVAPFTENVSADKHDPIYNIHGYHTKVPPKAIQKYIEHYTKPGDIVFDGFCGSGMTGIAAQLCEYTTQNDRGQARNAILCDLGSYATYISGNYNTPIDFETIRELEEDIQNIKVQYGKYYQTIHNEEVSTSLHQIKGEINYVVWSNVYTCPHCNEEIIYYDLAVDKETNKTLKEFKCNSCKLDLNKKALIPKIKSKYDVQLEKNIEVLEKVPVLINYIFNKKRYTKKPDLHDLRMLEEISSLKLGFIPKNEIISGDETDRMFKEGITHVKHLYFDRSLFFISMFYERFRSCNKKMFLLTSALSKLTILNRYMPEHGSRALVGPRTGTYYLPPLCVENDVIGQLEFQLKKLAKLVYKPNNVIVSTQSTTDLRNIPNNSIDYVFIDPPFGANIMYSELSFIAESWLKVFTNNQEEAIMNKSQHKDTYEYKELMENCFKEIYRIMKPNRWLTLEFHNSKNSIWNTILQGLGNSGFVIADVRVLNKEKRTINQSTIYGCVDQDLVLTAYKPKDKFIQKFIKDAGTIEGVWEFIDQHLEKLPIVAPTDEGLSIIQERQKYLLYDAMLAYHIQRGAYIPINAIDFYSGLKERYILRDEMYFLADQISIYEDEKQKQGSAIQLSYIITNEKDAIGFLSRELALPQTYQELQPKFIKVLKQLKYEEMPEMIQILEDNFLQDEKGKWYIPDISKQGDMEKLREKKLLKQFNVYCEGKGKLKHARTEAIQAGFKKAWKEKDFETIVKVGNRLPDSIILEDQKLFMYYDNAKLQVEE